MIAERWISPLDDKGEPVDPLNLPAFLEPRNWDLPSCFCVMRGAPRKAHFLIPTWKDSPAYNKLCLVCPDSSCCYFGERMSSPTLADYSNLSVYPVNVSELFTAHKNSLLSVEETGSTEGRSESSENCEYASASPASSRTVTNVFRLF